MMRWIIGLILLQASLSLKSVGLQNAVAQSKEWVNNSELAVKGTRTDTTTRPLSEEARVSGLLDSRFLSSILAYGDRDQPYDKYRFTEETDIALSMAKQSSGLQIRGSASSIFTRPSILRMRGAVSLWKREPLVVVDGTPLIGSTIHSYEGSLNLNPENISDVTFLKPGPATALFGLEGESGVILITSKRPTRDLIEFSSTLLSERLYVYPRFQNTFAGGRTANFRRYTWESSHPIEWKQLDGSRYYDYSTPEAWGPQFDGGDYIPWHAWYPNHDLAFQTQPMVPHSDNVKKLFKAATVTQHALRLARSGDLGYVNLSFQNLDRSAIVPKAGLKRFHLALNSSVNVTKSLQIGANINLMDEQVEDIEEPAEQVVPKFFLHAGIETESLINMRNYRSLPGTLVSWNHPNPDDQSDFLSPSFNRAVMHYNPFDVWDNSRLKRKNRAITGDLHFNLHLSSRWNAFGAIRQSNVDSRVDASISTLLARSGTLTGVESGYSTGREDLRQSSFELATAYKDQIGLYSWSVLAGGNIQLRNQDYTYSSTAGGLKDPDIFEISNSRLAPELEIRSASAVTNSIYSLGSLQYDSLVFVHFSARNDWYSSLNSDVSAFFPAAGIGFLFSKFTKDAIPFLTYGNFRANWGFTGSSWEPFQPGFNTRYFLDRDGRRILTDQLVLSTDLRVPRITGLEAAVDLGLFNHKFNASVALYKNSKQHEVFPARVSATSGNSYILMNGGSMVSKGIEISLSGTAFSRSRFSWTMLLAASYNASEILKPGGSGRSDVYLAAANNNMAADFVTFLLYSTEQSAHRVGQLIGTGIKRQDGIPVLNSDGTFQLEDNVVFGSVLAPMAGSLSQVITFGRLSISVALEFQRGGKYFSWTSYMADYLGLSARTAILNENGVNVREPVEDGGGVGVSGVNEFGQPVQIYLDAHTYYRQFATNKIIDNAIFDSDYLKMRELALMYRFTLPAGSPIRSASLSLICRNPWLIYSENPDVDPSELAQGPGNFNHQPSVRAFGLSLKVTL